MSQGDQESNSEKCLLEFAVFEGSFGDANVVCNLTRLDGSFFIYVGDKGDPCFDDLSVAMQVPASGGTTSSSLIGKEESDLSAGIARRLGEKLKVPVFLSFNSKMTGRKLIVQVEEWLKKEIVERYGA